MSDFPLEHADDTWLLTVSFRNVGYGSLSIWTHHLRGIEFKEEWNPSVGGPLATKQSAVIIGSGVQWKELYGAAYKYNKTVVGGASPVRLSPVLCLLKNMTY
jgi:hypothetical protein